MLIQVCTLMPMRTTMNYQYRHGTTTGAAFRTLYADGGIVRFYRGIAPALLQGPLSRFGDTAANAGVLAALEHPSTKELPVFFKSMLASGAAAAWRICLMPIDTTKTIMQVEGKNGFSILKAKIGKSGPKVLFHGALAASGATYVGHFPWFFTYNYLQAHLPHYDENSKVWKLARNAFIGFSASVCSDTISNSVRVTKTTKQTFASPISYPEAVKYVIEKDGVMGLFGRGLKTRLLANGLQGLLFSVLWRSFEERINKMF